jgi:hypothetical protein
MDIGSVPEWGGWSIIIDPGGSVIIDHPPARFTPRRRVTGAVISFAQKPNAERVEQVDSISVWTDSNVGSDGERHCRRPLRAVVGLGRWGEPFAAVFQGILRPRASTQADACELGDMIQRAVY